MKAWQLLVSIVFGLLAGFFAHASATTIRVPEDCGSIQLAIIAAEDGDTVFVHMKEGGEVYAEDLVIDRKSITLRGEYVNNVLLDGTLSIMVDMWQEVRVEELQVFRGVSALGSRGGVLFSNVVVYDAFEASIPGGYVGLADWTTLSFQGKQNALIGSLTNVIADQLVVTSREETPRFAVRNDGGTLELTNCQFERFQAAVVNTHGGATIFAEGNLLSEVVTPVVNNCGTADLRGVAWQNCN